MYVLIRREFSHARRQLLGAVNHTIAHAQRLRQCAGAVYIYSKTQSQMAYNNSLVEKVLHIVEDFFGLVPFLQKVTASTT